MTQEDRDEALAYMVEEQSMDKSDPEDRNRILDHLGKFFGRDVQR